MDVVAVVVVGGTAAAAAAVAGTMAAMVGVAAEVVTDGKRSSRRTMYRNPCTWVYPFSLCVCWHGAPPIHIASYLEVQAVIIMPKTFRL